MRMIRFLPVAMFAVVPMLAVPATAIAGKKDSDKAERKQRDHDMARQAVLRREVVPLPRILTLVSGYQPGEVIEIELEGKNGQLIYDVHVLTDAGAVRELLVDARSGKLIVNRSKGD